MDTIKLKMPRSLHEYAIEVSQREGYDSPDAFIIDLVRDYQNREKHLENLLLDGIDSGELIEFTPEWWKKRKNELLKKYSLEETP